MCTLIDESEVLECQAAEDAAVTLRTALPDLHVGLVHGRLKPAEKAQVMTDFKDGKLDLLVATTVIEVGVDVPNASIMIIENPERLGLAQLHQLRGRVGRGAVESQCVLMYQSPLAKTATQRLGVLRAALIPKVQEIAYTLWDKYPSHAQAIINRWIGHKEQYGHA